MPITTITLEEKEKNALENILDREIEIDNYQINIDNYLAILKSLPSEWTAELEQFKGMDSQQIVIQVPLESIDIVSDLIFYDKVSFLLRTEIIEQRKAKHIYNAIVSQQDQVGLKEKLVLVKEARKIITEAV